MESYTFKEILEKRITSDMISDANIKRLEYAINYFELPARTDETIYWESLRPILVKRLKQIEENERAAYIAKRDALEAAEQRPAKLSGQLWEDCERCGGEGPIYMSHGCCADCAKGA